MPLAEAVELGVRINPMPDKGAVERTKDGDQVSPVPFGDSAVKDVKADMPCGGAVRGD